MSETSFSPSLEEIWAYEPKTNLLKIKSWEEKGLFHGFQLGLPDLKNKDTTDWCKLQARSDLHLLKQVHGNRVVDARVDSSNQGLAEADGWFLDQDSAENVRTHPLGFYLPIVHQLLYFQSRKRALLFCIADGEEQLRIFYPRALKNLLMPRTWRLQLAPQLGFVAMSLKEKLLRDILNIG